MKTDLEGTMNVRDSGEMSSMARFAEVAELLAQGFVRLLKSRTESSNSLDDFAESEAPCVSTVNGGRAARKET